LCAHFFVGYWWIVVVVNKSISTNYQRLIYFWKTVKWFSWSSCLLISKCDIFELLIQKNIQKNWSISNGFFYDSLLGACGFHLLFGFYFRCYCQMVCFFMLFFLFGWFKACGLFMYWLVELCCYILLSLCLYLLHVL
jgi:hypothetical protein